MSLCDLFPEKILFVNLINFVGYTLQLMLKEFKPILIFLVKFVLAGGILIFLYNLYLNIYHQHNLSDPYSVFVAEAVAFVNNTLGFHSYTRPDPSNPWVWIWMDGRWASYINEGCNAISIMIMFVSFVIAFSKGWLKTFLFIVGGLIIIQIMNIFRIVLLNWIFVYHNDYEKPAHDYLFPAIIYGTIVVLWIIWVKYFALKIEKKTDDQVA